MITVEKVLKTYQKTNGQVNALDDVSLKLNKGNFIVLQGSSGSGKTTLLMAIGGMLRPTKGKILFGQDDLYAMSMKRLADFRAKRIGFVFQMFHLVPYLNVMENVLLAMRSTGKENQKSDAGKLLENLGLQERLRHRPSELSAGEKQRVAIARAMINNPDIILADEPTGNLDPKNASAVLGYLSNYHKKGGTVVLATHQAVSEKIVTGTICLKNGRLED